MADADAAETPSLSAIAEVETGSFSRALSE